MPLRLLTCLSESQDAISEDPETHGSMFVPIVLGSDKTTVSVATGHNQFYPLYASIGNIHNEVRRAHRNAVSVIGFLAIPHGELLSILHTGQTNHCNNVLSRQSQRGRGRFPSVSAASIP
jgi:hypothetical protein